MKDESLREARPLLFILHPSSLILSSFPFQLDFLQESVHASPFFFHLVPHEMNLWSTRQVE